MRRAYPNRRQTRLETSLSLANILRALRRLRKRGRVVVNPRFRHNSRIGSSSSSETPKVPSHSAHHRAAFLLQTLHKGVGWRPGRQQAGRPASGNLDCPEPNRSATTTQHGLYPVFETARMYRGRVPDLSLARTYGITTFELG
jgi:hypothetical protein